MKKASVVMVVCGVVLAIIFSFGCKPVTMGRTFRDDVDVKVNSMTEASALEAGSSSVQPAAGRVFLICNVTLTNKRRSPFMFYPFQVLWSPTPESTEYNLGYVGYSQSTAYANFHPIVSPIAAGASGTGDVVYEVAPGTRPGAFRMAFDPRLAPIEK